MSIRTQLYTIKKLMDGNISLITEKSLSGQVEKDGIINFSIGIFNVNTGAIASGDIDITGISASLQKSTGGGAFSASGITQPTFSKAAGSVYCNYRFLAAEWDNGDIYKLSVSGISCEIDSETLYIETMVWSNMIVEQGTVEGKVDAVNADIGDFSAQTNLQSLLAALGIPDVAGKDLYTCLITDRLDDATNGLANLKSLIDAIKAITDVIPDAGALTSIAQDSTVAKAADLATVDTVVDGIKAVTDLLPDAGALTSIAQDATVAKAADLATVDTVVDGIKAVTDLLPDAGALTSIAQDATVAKAAQLNPTIASATFSYLDAGGVQDMVEITNTAKVLVKSICVDCNTLTQNGILAFWTKVDGTNYRRLSNIDVAFTVATDDSVCVKVDIETDKDFKFTWEELGGDEAAARDLPYKLSYEVRG